MFEFGNGCPHSFDGERIFVTNVKNAFMRADRHGGDCQSLDDAKRKRLQNHPVHERAGIAFVAIGNDIFDFPCLLSYDAPLLAGGKPGAAAAAQSGFFNRGNDLRA